jgi:PKD repeat protein
MNPSHTYAQPGMYSVSLVVGGGADTLVQESLITVLPAEESTEPWLAQSFPNPFKNQAVIEYYLTRAEMCACGCSTSAGRWWPRW